MFDNVALNIVIGLVFIYLLYSLFATVVSEIIATKLGLRARNMKEAIDRMINDDNPTGSGFLRRLWDSLKLTKNPTNPRIEKFYSNPEIKYLGSSGIFKNPSSFKAITFSRTLLYELNDGAAVDMNLIRQELLYCIDPEKYPRITRDVNGNVSKRVASLDKQSAQFVLSLFNDSYGDLVKFKLQLEAWFDRTMEQATEWYKRKIQVVLLVLGFMIAWTFNADTFTIISKLSTDKDARDKIVTLAAAYNDNNQRPGDPQLNVPAAKIDSLNNVKNKLEKDIVNANTILGLGCWLPDTVIVSYDPVKKVRLYDPALDEMSFMPVISEKYQQLSSGKIPLTKCNKWHYFFQLFYHHFFGFLITAIAISLGAPFWFDLLNKLMKLRTSLKQDTNSTNTTASGVVSPLNREG